MKSSCCLLFICSCQTNLSFFKWSSGKIKHWHLHEWHSCWKHTFLFLNRQRMPLEHRELFWFPHQAEPLPVPWALDFAGFWLWDRREQSQVAPFSPPGLRNLLMPLFLDILKPEWARAQTFTPQKLGFSPSRGLFQVCWCRSEPILVTTGEWKTDNLRLKLQKGGREMTTIFLPWDKCAPSVELSLALRVLTPCWDVQHCKKLMV